MFAIVLSNSARLSVRFEIKEMRTRYQALKPNRIRNFVGEYGKRESTRSVDSSH
jgi:hypothetical protein